MYNGSVKLDVFALTILISYEMLKNSLAIQFHKLLDEKSAIYFQKSPLRNSQIANGTIYEDGIPHVEINELNPDINKIQILEDTFKNILAMNGVKYIFQRSFYWRTWRQIEDIEGKSKLVCYKCENIFNETCRSCNCGHWEIEENPPCPFEIFSVINDTNICVAYYNQLKYSKSKCPSIINFRDVGNCDNPLKTRWRVSRQHDTTDISERHINVICKKREICEFSTVYSIFPDRVTFKIINSSNNVMYSRVMKNNNRNYACLNTCGMFNTPTEKQDQKMLQSQSNTRKDFGEKTTGDTKAMNKVYSNTVNPNSLQRNTHLAKDVTTSSTLRCKHLQTTQSEEEYEENENSDY